MLKEVRHECFGSISKKLSSLIGHIMLDFLVPRRSYFLPFAIITARKTPFFRRYCFQLLLYVVDVFLCLLCHSVLQEIFKISQPNFQA